MMNHTSKSNSNKNLGSPDLSLKGKTIAVIDASDEDIPRLQAACKHFQARLIISNNETTVYYAVRASDHVMCLKKCPRLCEAAFESCALSGKEVFIIENDTISSFNKNLQKIAIEHGSNRAK